LDSFKLDAEGYTGATGSDSLNQRLSEQRAEAVRGYLESQRSRQGRQSAIG
jgi:outer membrane protein OmpA-like peptidoglycan-associated protein